MTNYPASYETAIISDKYGCGDKIPVLIAITTYVSSRYVVIVNPDG